jgi:hypothetical protein
LVATGVGIVASVAVSVSSSVDNSADTGGSSACCTGRIGFINSIGAKAAVVPSPSSAKAALCPTSKLAAMLDKAI